MLLHPPSLVVGIGSSSDATASDTQAALAAALFGAGLAEASVGEIATIDRRRDHPAITALAARLGVRVVGFAAALLETVAVPRPSATVRAAVGTGSVAEAAALLAAGTDGRLVLEKRITPRVTVALARRAGPRGTLAVVGLGPGLAEHRTPAAERAVRRAEVVVGYSGYVEQCRTCSGRLRPSRPSPSGPSSSGPGSPWHRPPRGAGWRWSARATPGSTPWRRPCSRWRPRQSPTVRCPLPMWTSSWCPG